MTELKKINALSPAEKQYTVLPSEVDPKSSPSRAMVAALKAKEMAKKIRTK